MSGSLAAASGGEALARHAASPRPRCRRPRRGGPRRRRHRVHAGEGAERRQHADRVAEPEARQAQVVAAAHADADAGMQVAGEHVRRRRPAADGGRGRSRPGASGSSTTRMPSAAGGSPARSSWLPRTSTSSSARVRGAPARPPRASVAGACARAECRKSPRKTSAARRCAAPAPTSAASVSLVVPRGTGTPRARKLTALPMCASATSSVRAGGDERRLLGQQGERPAAGQDRRRHRAAACSADEQAQRDVEVLGGALAKARAREALQAADRERGQHRRLGVGIDGRRRRARGLGARRAGSGAAATRCGRRTGSCAPAGARSRTPARRRPSPASSPGSSRRTAAAPSRIRCTCASALGSRSSDLVDEREDALLDELDQALEHLRLAREVAVERGLGDVEPGRERGGGDALGARLLQHRRQRLAGSGCGARRGAGACAPAPRRQRRRSGAEQGRARRAPERRLSHRLPRGRRRCRQAGRRKASSFGASWRRQLAKRADSGTHVCRFMASSTLVFPRCERPLLAHDAGGRGSPRRASAASRPCRMPSERAAFRCCQRVLDQDAAARRHLRGAPPGGETCARRAWGGAMPNIVMSSIVIIAVEAAA